MDIHNHTLHYFTKKKKDSRTKTRFSNGVLHFTTSSNSSSLQLLLSWDVRTHMLPGTMYDGGIGNGCGCSSSGTTQSHSGTITTTGYAITASTFRHSYHERARTTKNFGSSLAQLLE